MAKITLENGATFEGTVEEIQALVEAFGVEKEAEVAELTESEYRKITRYGIGDFVKFTDTGDLPSYIKPDKYYEIVEIDGGDAVINDEDGDSFDTCGYDVEYFEKDGGEEVVAETLKVGDYAKVVRRVNEFEKGNIVKIVGEKADGSVSGFDFKVNFVNVTGASKIEGQTYGYIDAKNIVKATESEIAEAKAEAERQAANAKWAKIGRKPNEYKEGDVVHDGSDRPIFTVLSCYEIAERNVQFYGDDGSFTVDIENIELITPVEARFDRA